MAKKKPVDGNGAIAPTGQTEVATQVTTEVATTDAALPDLAARIKTEHAAVGTGARRTLEHAMAAGDLLIEAKALLNHGHWLRWLKEQCAIPERTAQLYMRLAKRRDQIRNVADLSIRDALEVLAPADPADGGASASDEENTAGADGPADPDPKRKANGKAKSASLAFLQSLQRIYEKKQEEFAQLFAEPHADIDMTDALDRAAIITHNFADYIDEELFKRTPAAKEFLSEFGTSLEEEEGNTDAQQ